MEQFLAELKPVSEWDFRLYKVVWRNNHTGQEKVLFCVSTNAHIHDECQRRWPGDYYHEYMEYDLGGASRPAQIGTMHGRRIDEDGWAAGERLRAQRGL